MLKSLFWIGATGIALVAGIALHHGDDIERGVHEIEASVQPLKQFGETVEREFDEAEVAIEDGADPEQSYEDALASALVSSGIFTLDNIDELSAEDIEQQALVNDGVRIDLGDVIDLARGKLEQARDAGELPQVDESFSASDIQAFMNIMRDVEDFNTDLQSIEMSN